MNRQEFQDRPLHGRALELAAAAIDFDLTSAEAGELDAHLAACPTCARRAAALRADASTLRAPLTLLPSPRVDAAINAAIARRQARPQRVLLLAAAGLLLVALLGVMAVGAYLLRNWEILPTTVVPTPSAPVTAVSPPPDSSPVAVGETWRPLAIPPSDVGTGWIGLMEAVAITDSGFVAVGGPVCVPQNEPTTCHGSVWTAAPGEGWIHASDQPGLELGVSFPTSGPAIGILDVSAGPAGLLAIGYAGDDGIGPGIWRSPDGRTWQRVNAGATFANATINAVTSRAERYVIVGTVADPARAVGPARAAAWASPDGLVWTRATDSAAMDAGTCVDTGETPFCGGMLAVTATATGFVAVGETCPGTFEGCSPAAWSTADGANWVRIDAGLDFSGRLDAVAVGAPGIVAAGRSCSGSQCSGVNALSADGSTWTFVSVTGMPSEENRLASDRGIVLGTAWDYEDARFQVWRTTDGLTREPIEALSLPSDIQRIEGGDIAVLGDQVVIVARAWMEIPHDSGLPAQMNLSFQSP